VAAGLNINLIVLIVFLGFITPPRQVSSKAAVLINEYSIDATDQIQMTSHAKSPVN
jgi:hypothetical protein